MDQRFDFDPQLPALPLAFDLGAVARLFEERWPGTADSAGRPEAIVRCSLQDTKYQPARRCVTTYRLLAEQPGASPRQTIGVIEITPEGAAHRLYTDDPALPWLVPMADPAAVRERFAAMLADTPIDACAVTPIRYKPGARCVFRYNLQTRSGERVFFGKLLAKDGDQLMATIATLHQVSEAVPAMPRIPRPAAYWPEPQMLIQPAVAGGAELNTLAFDPAEESAVRERWLRDAGACLAALHDSAGAAGPRRALDDDLDELREYVAPMAAAAPELVPRYEDAIERIAALARGRDEPGPVASHGAFRTDQFMIEDGRLVMIDLDGFCWANPARDLGNFLAYLGWKAIRNLPQATFIERAGDLFLEGYQAGRPAPDPRWLTIYRAASLLKIAGRRFRSLTYKEWPLVPRLLDAAETGD